MISDSIYHRVGHYVNVNLDRTRSLWTRAPEFSYQKKKISQKFGNLNFSFFLKNFNFAAQLNQTKKGHKNV